MASDELRHLNDLRAAEVARIGEHLAAKSRVLEIGAGNGQQSVELSRRGFEVYVIDVTDRDLTSQPLFPIQIYDGRHIPFENEYFHVVFSSNVLEHVTDLPALHREIQRVLVPGGKCVHVLPTSVWRVWTSLATFPALVWQTAAAGSKKYARSPAVQRGLRVALHTMVRLPTIAYRTPRQERHGERGNYISEVFYFRPAWWRRHFLQNRFEITAERPMGLFYTGHTFTWAPRSLARMERWAVVLGSSSHLFELRVKDPEQAV